MASPQAQFCPTPHPDEDNTRSTHNTRRVCFCLVRRRSTRHTDEVNENGAKQTTYEDTGGEVSEPRTAALFPSKHRIRIVALDVEGDSCQLARSAITVENVSRMIGPRPLSRAVLTLRRTSLSSCAPRAPRSCFLPRPSTLRRLARRRNYEKKNGIPKLNLKKWGNQKREGEKRDRRAAASRRSTSDADSLSRPRRLLQVAAAPCTARNGKRKAQGGSLSRSIEIWTASLAGLFRRGPHCERG